MSTNPRDDPLGARPGSRRAPKAGAITADPSADYRALAWHAYLWDPWFLIWGLLTLLLVSRPIPDRQVVHN